MIYLRGYCGKIRFASIIKYKLNRDATQMKWFEIFSTGTHTDSNGNTRNWTEADLDKVVNNYDPKNHEAPIVIGHPKDNKPAFGWIQQLKRAGNKLLAFPKQVVPEFAEMIEKGLFKKRSSSFYADGSLRHVGFLGAQPPAVKGLTDVEFKEEDIAEYEFAEETETEDVTKLKDQIASLQVKVNNYEELKGKVKDYDEVTAEKIKAEEELNRLNVKMRMMEFQQYLNEKVAYGSLTPAQKEKAVKVIEILDNVDLVEQKNSDKTTTMVYEFSDGSKENPTDIFKEFLESLPKQLDFDEEAKKEKAADNEGDVDVSEFSDYQVNEESLEIHKKAVALQKKDDISYEEAVQKAVAKN